MENMAWIRNGSVHRSTEKNITVVPQISPGIYQIGLDDNGFYLEKTGEKFEFPFKVYGIHKRFIEHVEKAYHATGGNMGVLLSGTKGSGKTISAKLLCNDFGLPVIIVKSYGDRNQPLIEFLNSFNFDCVFFFDEFEKQFNDKDFSILQIMDGVYTSVNRRIFLLTTNETTVNENLLSRPSRIRYLHTFGNLEQEVVREFLNDCLVDKSCIEEIMSFVDTLEISTIDILKTICEEVNIFGYEEFMVTKHFFNVSTANYKYWVRYNAVCDGETYTIDDFIKDVHSLKVHLKPNRYDFEDADTFSKAYREWKNHFKKIPGDKEFVECEKKWSSYKPNDESWWGENYLVIKVDLKNHVIILRDIEENKFYFFYIDNPDAHPALYNTVSPEITYGYNL